MNIVVSGDRNYTDGFALRLFLAGAKSTYDELTIYHGGASGADRLAGAWCDDNGVPCKVFRANWEKYGKSAGPKRNLEMITTAFVNAAYNLDHTMLVAFKDDFDWSLDSGGTEHACLIANRLGLRTVVIQRMQGDYSDHSRLTRYADEMPGQGNLFSA